MSSEKDVAIVLRVIPFSESSYIVTLFTRQRGKISALAKGARRPKSPFDSALDLLALCRIVFIHKSSQALDLLTEAKLERRFRAASRDLSRLYAAYYVAELLRELTDEADPHPELFDAAERSLKSLDERNEVTREVLRFELVALRILGHLPSLDRCAECGREVSARGRLAFGQLVGGVLCGNCKAGRRQVIGIRAEGVQLLRAFADVKSESWKHINIDRRVAGELRGVLNHYISHLLGHPARMQKLLGVFTG